MKKHSWRAGALLLAGLLLAGCAAAKPYESSSYAMSTVVRQTVYGGKATEAAAAVDAALLDFEARLSLFTPGGDLARINAAAGQAEGVETAPETADLLRRALAVADTAQGAFALSIAPVTLAWNVMGEEPRVVPPAERPALAALVDDSAVTVDDAGRVRLARAGMGLDLGGLAKGEACRVAAAVYEEYGIESALLDIGGNVYACGTKPGGAPWSIGFRDPVKGSGRYIASFPLSDEVVAVSGGYERFFEAEGQRYIHIFNPATAAPAQSDVVSVGVLHPDGMTADVLSTTLFVWGRERALGYMREGGRAILLDDEGRLYVSESLREGFTLHEDYAGDYELIVVEEEGA